MPQIIENLQSVEFLGYDPNHSRPLVQNIHSETAGPVLFTDQNGINESASDSERTVASELLARYNFSEPASRLNIPKAVHDLYAAQERDGSQPLYVIFEMPSGYSRFKSEEAVRKPNSKPSKEMRHRYWPAEVIHSFADQIRQRTPVGYLGHEGFFSDGEVPENIPVKWESSIKATRKSDGVAVTLARGYTFDSGLNRTYFKTGVYHNASVNAVGAGIIDTTKYGSEKHPVLVIESAQLDSFDIVRRGNHGIPATRHIASISNKERIHKMDPENTNGQNGGQGLGGGFVVTAETMFNRMNEQQNLLAENNLKIRSLEVKVGLLENVATLFGCSEDKIIETVKASIAQSETWRNETISFFCEKIEKQKTRSFVETHMRLSEANSMKELQSALKEAFALLAEATGTENKFDINSLLDRGNGTSNTAETVTSFGGGADTDAFVSNNFAGAGGKA